MVGGASLPSAGGSGKGRRPRAEVHRESTASPGGGRVDHMVVATSLLAVFVLVLAVLDTKTENWTAVVLLGLAFAASEYLCLALKPAGRLSLALVPLMIAVMHTGPLGVALVPLAGIPVFYLDRGKRGLRRAYYNTVQYVVSAGVAGLVFWHAGGAVILKEGHADIANALNAGQGTKLILPTVLATLLFFALNTLLIAPVLAGESGERVFRYWERRMLNKLPGYVIYSGIGFLTAIAYSRLQFTAVVLVLAPVFGVRHVYRRYGKMRDVCDDTAVAVIEAIESGDVFSEGHSVGVADTAVAIAEELDFQEEDIHFIRQAALFHDIGKLVLDPSIVGKPSALTPEEFEEIKKHPIIAAKIVSREPSLAAVAPAIAHHHEMIDGTGYVDGLSGETIPLGARVLAVADAFDAMQRTAPHRGPMSAYEAAAEVIRCKGVQYDPEVVDAFVRVVTKMGTWEGSLADNVRMTGRSSAVEKQSLEGAVQASLIEEGDSAPDGPADRERPARNGGTPAESIAYSEVRGEIEKDIKQWKRTDSERKKTSAKAGGTGKAFPFKRKKEEPEGPPPSANGG